MGFKDIYNVKSIIDSWKTDWKKEIKPIKSKHGGVWEPSLFDKDEWTIYVKNGEMRVLSITETSDGRYGVILNRWNVDAGSPYDWDLLSSFKNYNKAKEYAIRYMKNY